MRVRVNYINVLEGGAGMTDVYLEDLCDWLAVRPAVVIRELTPHLGLVEGEKFRKTRVSALHALGDRLLSN